MKKISIIDHVGNKAGMDYYSSSLANGLVCNGSKVYVYSNYIGIHSSKINYIKYYEGHNQYNNFIKLYKFVTATIKSSYKSYKQKSDLVIVHLFEANVITLLLVLIPKLFFLRVAVISHDVSSFINNDSQLFQNLIYNKLANEIIVHNQFSYTELVKNMKQIDIKKISIIKHGGYLDYIKTKLDKSIARKELGLNINDKYILFFGQIKEVKGLDILLQAMSTVPEDIKLIIAGKPWKSDFNQYDLLITKYNLEKRIIKKIYFIEDSEREKLFFAADINVLPYRIIYQSGVLLMAMSYGLPTIASDLAANKEIIENNYNGILFASENSQDLSASIAEVFTNRLLQEKISINSLKTIEKSYSWIEIAKKYYKL